MKTIANLVVLVSLFFGQFNGPYTSQSSASIGTPTATAPIPGGLETPTPTLPPTETSTPAPSETATPAPTGTDVPPAEPVIAINLYATPGFVTPGGHINIDWAVEGIVPAEHELLLNITLPKGFTPTDKDIQFDETTSTFSIPVLKESGKFGLQADQPAEDAVLLASLVEKEASLAEFTLPLPTREQFSVDQKGGDVVAEEGRVKISFPENVFTEDTTIAVGQPSGKDRPEQSLSGKPFEIIATTKADKTELHQFEKPITIEVQYGDLNIPEEKLSDLFIYWYNPETKDWEAMDSALDRKTQTIRTETNHFSVFDINVNSWQATRMPSVDSFQVSQFTGAATYSMPINMPAGPGGFQPSLSLSYSSQVVDQATVLTQSGWLGMGWSLENSYIETDTHGTTSDRSDDTYLLNVNGTTTRLLKDANNQYYL